MGKSYTIYQMYNDDAGCGCTLQPKRDLLMSISVARRGLALAIALLLLCLPAAAPAEQSGLVSTVVEPTCTEAGYILTTDPAAGSTTVQNLPAVGHSFTPWQPDAAGNTESRSCTVCGFRESLRISTIPEEDMPRLYLTGSLEGIGKKNKVVLEAAYTAPDRQFDCYAVLTMQGHSTFGCPKHNYTIRFYRDRDEHRKHKVTFRNWGEEHKYILKANYYDLSACRNLVGAQLWSRMTATRQGLSPRLAALPLLGAVDGFPVEVYLNGEYFGLYTLNLHKDDDLYGMGEGEETALAICNRSTTGEALFRAPAAFLEDYSSDWEIEYCGTLDEAWARDSFNSLIHFVMESSDETFRRELHTKLDVDAAIDYLLFIYALGLPDSCAKDLVMLHFDGVWIPSAYDMDEAFGLDADKGVYLSSDAFLPCREGGVWSSGTGSLLWDRLLNGFEQEIRARYRQLRATLLTEESLLSLVESFVGSIPEACYDRDRNLYPARPLADSDMQAQITDYITKRFGYLDLVLEAE